MNEEEKKEFKDLFGNLYSKKDVTPLWEERSPISSRTIRLTDQTERVIKWVEEKIGKQNKSRKY